MTERPTKQRRSALSTSAGAFAVLAVIVGFCFTGYAEGEFLSEQELEDLNLQEYLQPIPGLEPIEALKSLEVIPGLTIELAAHEPTVVDPVAGAIDEQGNFYVAELRDYPFRPEDKAQPLGRIRLLRDNDGDGFYEASTIFADGLLWAAGVAAWKGGVFVSAPPDIWYFKDTTGDGVADEKHRVFTGFGTDGSQYILNNLIWGMDHRIYASVAGNGGEVRLANDLSENPLSLRRKDFSFDPLTFQYAAESGGVQFGNSFDDWGNRFLCSQDSPLSHVVLPLRCLERNPFLSVPTALNEITRDNIPIFRASPLERWRIIRSSRRVVSGKGNSANSGVSHNVADGCAGTVIYSSQSLGPDFYGNAFTGDAQSNLVHRRGLIPSGTTFESVRLDQETEVIRSRDNWFRPVNFVEAPDGTLFVLDLCREILEAVHIPFDVVEHLDLTNGRDRGRIYRLKPAGFAHAPFPKLGTASSEELIGHLESPNRWERETAHRLLYERQDQSVVPGVQQLVRTSSVPQARLLGLYTLAGLGSLTESDLLTGLRDAFPAVRQHSVLLAEPRMNSSTTLADHILDLAADPDARVRFQVALTIGEMDSPRAVEGLTRMLRTSGGDQWIRFAALSSARNRAGEILARFTQDASFESLEGASALARDLASMTGAQQDSAPIRSLMGILSMHRKAPVVRSVLSGLLEGLQSAGANPREAMSDWGAEGATLVSRQVQMAFADLKDGALAEGRMLEAVSILGFGEWVEVSQAFAKLLEENPPESIQSAVIRILSRFEAKEVGEFLLSHWRVFKPQSRTVALEGLLARDERVVLLLDAIEAGRVMPGEIPAAQRARLLEGAHKERATRILASSGNATRHEVIESYRPCLGLTGDTAKGRETFVRLCAVCHRLGNEGNDLGPNLALISTQEPEQLLVQIIDPNREVNPAFIQYTVVDVEGNESTGILRSETESALTIARQDIEESFLRENISEVRAGGLSLMPEGLETGLSLEDMGDLLAFLGAIQYDIGTSGTSYSEGRYPDSEE